MPLMYVRIINCKISNFVGLALTDHKELMLVGPTKTNCFQIKWHYKVSTNLVLDPQYYWPNEHIGEF